MQLFKGQMLFQKDYKKKMVILRDNNVKGAKNITHSKDRAPHWDSDILRKPNCRNDRIQGGMFVEGLPYTTVTNIRCAILNDGVDVYREMYQVLAQLRTMTMTDTCQTRCPGSYVF